MRSCSPKFFVFFVALLLSGIAVFVVKKRVDNRDHHSVEPNIIQQITVSPPLSDTDKHLLAAMQAIVDKSTQAEIKKGIITAEEARKIKNTDTPDEKERNNLILIEEINNKCGKDNLSVSACEERKKAAVADIEFNILPSEFPFRNNAALEQWREKRQAEGAAYELLLEESEICSGID